MVQIHSVYTGPVRNENGTVPYGSIRDDLHKWIHLVPASRSDPYRIHQVPCKHKAYPYQLISYWLQTDLFSCKRCLSIRQIQHQNNKELNIQASSPVAD